MRVTNVHLSDEQNLLPKTPGELSGFLGNNGQECWAFMGDGVHLTTDVTARVLEETAKRDQDLQAFVDAPEAARFIAALCLRDSNNASLKISVDDPVPQGELFQMDIDLKQVLAPYKNNLDTLRQAVANIGMGQQENPTTGNVRSCVARGLPVDPTV